MKSLFFSVLSFLLFSYQVYFPQIINRRIDQSTYRPNEVVTAVNPLNTDEIVVGSNINYFYKTTDGGVTWQTYELTSPYNVYGDPCVIYDSYGQLYFSHLSVPPFGYFLERLVVQTSTDNGDYWKDSVSVGYSPPKQQDKEWLAADFNSSSFKGNVYMAWTQFDVYGSSQRGDSTRILFARSTNRGSSWSEPVRISDKAGNCEDSDLTVEGAVPAVGPNGEVYLSWSGPMGIMFDKSTEGGVNFGRDIYVTNLAAGWDFDVSGLARCNGFPISACDVSNSSFRGNIYIVYGDQVQSSTNSDIFFVKSTNGGSTWSFPSKVNGDNTTRHQFFPWMSVDQTNGYIYVIYYDRRNTTGLDTDVFLARSKDGGNTFEEFKITDAPFSLPSGGIFLGDYIGIAAYDGRISTTWTEAYKEEGSSWELGVWAAVFDDENLITSVYDNSELPADYNLLQNYPNPFNNSTLLGFQLPHRSFVSIKIYDVLGNEVENVVHSYFDGGTHEIVFNADNLSSGLYIYSLISENISISKKMILLK